MSEKQTTTQTEEIIETKIPLGEIDKIALTRYKIGLQTLNMLSKKLSARGLRRSLFAAIDFGITDGLFNFQKKEEAEFAGVLAQVFDLRNLILAKKLRENTEMKEEEVNGEDKQMG